jgi:hypothetical protein
MKELRMRSFPRFVFGLVFVFAITACQIAQPKGIAPAASLQPTSQTTPAPTSDPSKATVRGTVEVDLNGSVIPLKETSLFLSPILKDQNGVERAAQFNRSSSPYALTDSQGSFAFYNVQPGRYVIILDNVVTAYLLTETDSQYSLTLTATAGQVTDLKTLHYKTLPITPTP